MRSCSTLRSWVLNRRRLEDPSPSSPEPKKNLSVVRAHKGTSSFTWHSWLSQDQWSQKIKCTCDTRFLNSNSISKKWSNYFYRWSLLCYLNILFPRFQLSAKRQGLLKPKIRPRRAKDAAQFFPRSIRTVAQEAMLTRLSSRGSTPQTPTAM